jgi:CelD/BcsL family acetyltransferase involved in cellulose biosynthesis
VKIQIINPLVDSRWDDLVNRHPRSSAFHQRGWLQALSLTYGYEPCVLTSASAGDRLPDGVVLCRVSSWITGTRLVSLPFADHCEPLLNDENDFPEFLDHLEAECDRRQWKYVEFRPVTDTHERDHGLQPDCSYWAHNLDTKPCLEEILRGLHKNSFRRKIRRAQTERLSYEVGNSQQLLDEFYRLLLITRRRHQLLPQPRKWFNNLVTCMGDKVQIRLARKDGVPVAAMLTLRHRSSLVYKYGCSDKRFHNMGGMPFLFWKLVEECKASGLSSIDLGRSDLTNQGLIVFKDRLGAARKLLTYYRYTNLRALRMPNWQSLGFSGLCSILPDTVLSTAGGLVYRHIG